MQPRLSASTKKRLLKLQGNLLYEPFFDDAYTVEAVLEHENRLWRNHANELGAHWGSILDFASRPRVPARTVRERTIEAMDEALASAFFVTVVAPRTDVTRKEYARAFRGGMHKLARSSGIHVRFVMIASSQGTGRRSHIHAIVEVPNRWQHESNAIRMLRFLPDGKVCIYPRIPRGGDAKYIMAHDDHSNDSEPFDVQIACCRGDSACQGTCVVRWDDAQFRDVRRYHRECTPVPVVGEIVGGVFTPGAREMNGLTERRKKRHRDRARAARSALVEMNEDAGTPIGGGPRPAIARRLTRSTPVVRSHVRARSKAKASNSIAIDASFWEGCMSTCPERTTASDTTKPPTTASSRTNPKTRERK